MSESPPPPAPAPFNPDEATLPSSPHNAAAGSSGSAELKFRTKERDLSGAQLGGYKLVRKIAEGGMGEVYEAVQLKLDRRVAVKLLSEELSREPEFLARFEREAKSAAALNHANVVQVYDYGCAEGQYYFVMELVDGVDLSMHVKEHGKLAVGDAFNYFEQAVVALKFAASHAIIHRDVKPANLMLTREGVVKVSDLGLAKKLTDDSDVTMTGVGMGSPHFLAPEQADDAAHVDHRADIYSLGVTLLFLLTGKRPYEGASNFSVVLAHANKPLPTGFDLGTPLPDEVEGFIKRMTAKLPEARYQSYDELLTDLRRVKAGQRPSVNWGQVVRDPRNLQRLAVTAVVILIAALAVPMLLPDKQPPAPPITASPTPNPVLPPRDGQLQPHPDDQATRPRFGGDNSPAQKGKNQGGGSPPLLPMPPPPARNPTPLKDGPIPAMMAEADSFAAQNPDELTGIVDRYWQVVQRGRGTQAGLAAQRKLDNTMLAHELKSHEVIEKLQARMEALIKQNRLQEAFEVWAEYPTGWRTRETDQEIIGIIKRFMPPNFHPQAR